MFVCVSVPFVCEYICVHIRKKCARARAHEYVRFIGQDACANVCVCVCVRAIERKIGHSCVFVPARPCKSICSTHTCHSLNHPRTHRGIGRSDARRESAAAAAVSMLLCADSRENK